MVCRNTIVDVPKFYISTFIFNLLLLQQTTQNSVNYVAANLKLGTRLNPQVNAQRHAIPTLSSSRYFLKLITTFIFKYPFKVFVLVNFTCRVVLSIHIYVLTLLGDVDYLTGVYQTTTISSWRLGYAV